MTESRELYDTVIKNGYCIGCGACASKKDSVFKIKMDEFGNMVAFLEGDMDKSTAKVLQTCPFSGKSKNEDELADEFFSDVESKSSEIGKFISCNAGFVEEGTFRSRGSSGGMAKWIAYKLLKENKIDYFIQLVPNQINDPNCPLFDYAVFSNEEDVLKGSKSSYYPVTLVSVIDRILSIEGRYAITGVPCFVKTLRLLASENALLKQRIKFTIGIVCGGMKSANHSTMVGWELGIEPQNLVGIDFRRKYIDRPAHQKIYQVWSNADSIERYKNANEIYGTDYGAGFFKPNACDYCDDVVGETADISIGDAWLPQFVNDPKGTSIMVIRNSEIMNLLKQGQENNEISLFELTASEVVTSQSGGFRHRREALSMRLADRGKEGVWVPEKRIKPNQFIISKNRKEIYLLREQIAKKSHVSFLKALNMNDLKMFHKEMDPLVKKYYVANNGRFFRRTINRINKKINRFFK